MMTKGMLWFDNDKKFTFEQKVLGALEYYKSMYGDTRVCVVNPSMLPDGVSKIGDVDIKTSGSILKNHFWVGTEWE